MKPPIILLCLFALSACATRHQSVVHMTAASVPGTNLSPTGMEGVRYAENLKAYPLGRYIDPNDSDVMHEGHTIYRVETTGKWNLHPQESPISSIPAVRSRDSASAPMLLRDELAVELNRQREATKTIIQSGQTITQKLNDLASAVQNTRRIAEDTAQRQSKMDSVIQNLNSIEEDLRKLRQFKESTSHEPAIPTEPSSDWNNQ